MRIFKNKFFFAALAVALFLSAMSLTLAAMGRGDLLRNAAVTLTTPLRYVASWCADGVRGLGAYFGASKELNEQNESLRDSLASLSDAEARLAALEAENKRLREYLALRESHPEYRFDEAVAVGRSNELFASTLTLNRGTIHGIAVGMPVMTPDGLVGAVTEVGFNWCRVATLASKDTSVGAYIERSGVYGVVSGGVASDGSAGAVCVMEYLESGVAEPPETGTETDTDADATENDTESETESDTGDTEYLDRYGIDVRVGDRVMTAGVGAVYPYGIEIGTVREIRVDPYSRKLTLIIEPSADLSRRLTYLLIVTKTEAEP